MTARIDAIDAALLAYMLDGAAPIYGRLKIQKTPFFVEYRLAAIGEVASCFPYKRWVKGPFSQAVWNTLDLLVARDFIRSVDYGLTERGLALVDLIQMAKAQNETQFALIEDTLRYCKTRTGKQLMDEAYELEIEPVGRPGQRQKIRDLRKGVRLLHPVDRTISFRENIADVIEAEITVTPRELLDARKNADRIDRESFDRLVKAINS